MLALLIRAGIKSLEGKIDFSQQIPVVFGNPCFNKVTCSSIRFFLFVDDALSGNLVDAYLVQSFLPLLL